jgi:flavin reductase (DIM6/NTAB) family NADH-FMN oxidoreductase RutF
MTTTPAAQVFRDAMGRFPTGVALIGTESEGVPSLMTVSSFTSVSLEPLLVLVCVSRTTRFHDAVLSSGRWGVSFLAAHQEELSRRFAVHGRDLDTSLDGVATHVGAVTGVPLLDGSLVTLECRTTSTHDGGDHTIVVGAVVGLELGVDPTPALVWHRGDYVVLDQPGA